MEVDPGYVELCAPQALAEDVGPGVITAAPISLKARADAVVVAHQPAAPGDCPLPTGD